MDNMPLTDEQIWGDPEEILSADRLIEDILYENEDEGTNFDDAHYCPECGNPVFLCTCGASENEG